MSVEAVRSTSVVGVDALPSIAALLVAGQTQTCADVVELHAGGGTVASVSAHGEHSELDHRCTARSRPSPERTSQSAATPSAHKTRGDFAAADAASRSVILSACPCAPASTTRPPHAGHRPRVAASNVRTRRSDVATATCRRRRRAVEPYTADFSASSTVTIAAAPRGRRHEGAAPAPTAPAAPAARRRPEAVARAGRRHRALVVSSPSSCDRRRPMKPMATYCRTKKGSKKTVRLGSLRFPERYEIS